MFRSILVPTDGLDVGNSVLPTARTLARLSGGEIILVHVLPTESSRGWSRLADQQRRELERLQHELVAPDLRVSWYVRYGDQAKQIVETARELQVDLIAMVTLGLVGVDRVIAGTVTDEVLHRAPIPLLVSRWGTPPMCQLRRILVPTDGSPGAARALSTALPLAQASGASVTLLEVTEHVRGSAYQVANAGELGVGLLVGRDYEQANQVRATDYVLHIAQQLVENGYNATGEAVVGEPARSIVERADELHADLIVMSTHARTGATRTILGSVADGVVQQANSPVILVHYN